MRELEDWTKDTFSEAERAIGYTFSDKELLKAAFTQSALYALLDGRLRAGKKTVISTNLDRGGIESRYGAALASRLGGEYEWLEFLGRDIRAQRKEGI